MREFKRSNKLLWPLLSIGVLNGFWLTDMSHNTGFAYFLIASDALALLVTIILLVRRVVFRIEEGNITIRTTFATQIIPLSSVLRIEWREHPKESVLHLKDGKEIGLPVSLVSEADFDELQSFLNSRFS